MGQISVGVDNTSNIDQSQPTNRLDTVHGKVLQADLVLQQNGTPVTSFTSSSHSGSAYFLLKYSNNVKGGRYQIPLTFLEYYEDGHLTDRRTIHIEPGEQYNHGSWTWHFPVGPTDGNWKPGRYWAMIYNRDQKAAQIQWEALP